jgi:Flp pilus assembly protein TadD
VRQLLAQYQRTRTAQQRNTISYDNAQIAINQVTNGLLDVLAGIEAGRTAPELPDDEPRAAARRQVPWWAVALVLAVLGGVGYFLLVPGRAGDRITDEQLLDTIRVDSVTGKIVCPPYPEQSRFNIMVLPYQPLDGKQKKIESALRIRLSERIEQYKIAGAVFTRSIDVNSYEYPATSEQAAVLGKPCRAQLIIWGTTEERPGTNEVITTTKFRFIDSEHFSLTNLVLDNSASVDTISSISSIATNAELTENIERTIRLIFGLVAFETEHHALAADILEEVIEERGGVAVNPKWGMIQADSYIKSGQDERAIKVYEQILERDTANIQALEQSGLLLFRIGDIHSAEAHLSKAVAQDPTNTRVLVARAAARVQQNDLFQANTDLKQLEKQGAELKVTKVIRKDYDVRERAEKQRLATANKQLGIDPSDTTALRMKTEAARNLGQLQVASTTASQLLRVDPNNRQALTTMMEVASQVRDSSALKQKIEAVNPRIIQELQARGGIRKID